MVDMVIDVGINLFDTANGYAFGQSEIMLGKALGSRRKDPLIATKVYFPFGTSPNALGVSRLAIMREVEASLKRLGTELSIRSGRLPPTATPRWPRLPWPGSGIRPG